MTLIWITQEVMKIDRTGVKEIEVALLLGLIEKVKVIEEKIT